jgi:hypothetical protein
MRELDPDYFRSQDTDRWAGVVAATSPQQGVPLNLREALSFWKSWVDAGRPVDKDVVSSRISSGTIYRPTNLGSKLPTILLALNIEDILRLIRASTTRLGTSQRTCGTLAGM